MPTRKVVYFNVFCPCPENTDKGDQDFIADNDRAICKHGRGGPARNKLRQCLTVEDAHNMSPSFLLRVLFLAEINMFAFVVFRPNIYKPRRVIDAS